MALSPWPALAASFAVAFVVAFAIGWFVSRESRAYMQALGLGLVLVTLPNCTGMSASNPVQANAAAEEFFYLLPVFLAWLVFGVIAVASARQLKWRHESEQPE
jgi:hypothetical protein